MKGEGGGKLTVFLLLHQIFSCELIHICKYIYPQYNSTGPTPPAPIGGADKTAVERAWKDCG